jgi:hypothetical protein
MKTTIKYTVGLMALVTAAGCSNVALKPGAEEVEILEEQRVQKCDKLGTTTVSVSTKVGFIARGERAIEKDLKVLARNSGQKMGGDTVSSLTDVTEGEQKYGVYDCIDD